MAKLTKRNIDGSISKIVASGMARAGALLAKEMSKKIHINNQDGWYRSLPGDAPHHSTSGADNRIMWEVIPGNGRELPRLVMGVREDAAHLLMLELGTRPHKIRARRTLLLRIPWRAEGRGRRQPTPEEIKRIGLQPVGEVVRKGGRGKGFRGAAMEWVYYRPEVNHPGTAPRPWIVPTVMANLKAIGKLFVGNDVSLNFAKGILGATSSSQLRAKLEAYGGQLPLGPNRSGPGNVGPVPQSPIPRREIGPVGIPQA